MLGAGLGATILPLIAQALVNAFGWRTAYASLGTQHYFWARRSACATYGTEKLSHSRIHNTPGNFVRTHVAGGAALGCFLDHCWSSVGQTMHTGNVESMSEINNEGKCMNSIDFWWPGTELNRRRQPFQGCALPPELPGHLSAGPTYGAGAGFAAGFTTNAMKVSVS